jgi:hypothetical protein
MADDGTVTLEITWEGTQSGPLHIPTGDIPPSNRHVVVKAAQVFEMEGDKIREAHHYFDLMGHAADRSRWLVLSASRLPGAAARDFPLRAFVPAVSLDMRLPSSTERD